MTPKQINKALEQGAIVEGVEDSYSQYISHDQIAQDGIVAYKAYTINGVRVSAEEMQTAVDCW